MNLVNPFIVTNVVSSADSIQAASPLSYYTPDSIDVTATKEGDAVGSWADTMGSNTLSSVQGSPTLHIDSVTGKRQVRFDGIDDGMSVANNTIFDFAPSVDSFSFVIKLGEGTVTDDNVAFLSKGDDATNNYQYGLVARSSRHSIVMGGNNQNIFTGSTAGDLLILTVNSTTATLRRNGTEIGTSTLGVDTNSQLFSIGYVDGSTTYTFAPRDIERLAVFNKELSSEVVTSIETEFV